jgi:hypothetical protein
VSSSHPRIRSSRLALLFLLLTLAALALEFWAIRASLAGLFR